MGKPAVLISGCFGGLGKHLCQHFAAAGHAVLGIDKTAEDQANLASLQCDLDELSQSQSEQQRLSRWLADELETGKIDLHCLINNAAVQILGPTESLSSEDLQQSLRVNVTAAFVLTKLTLSVLEQNRGSIINIGSVHAKLTKPGFVAYATSKAALRGLTQSLAQDLRERVRVNLIEPAAIDTDMLRAGFNEDPEALPRLGKFHPVGRIADPREIAALALFLASDQAGFLTGGIFPADGGIGSSLHDPAETPA